MMTNNEMSNREVMKMALALGIGIPIFLAILFAPPMALAFFD